jgi:hypothetical protein
MYNFISSWLMLSFCANGSRTMDSMWQISGGALVGRAALKALSPGFPDHPAELPQEPVRSIPTDVPMQEPMDIPVREPQDVPAPEPGGVPPASKPRPDEKNPKPRSVPYRS